MKQKLFSKTMAFLLAFAMLLSFVPAGVFASEHDGQVRVIVENTTFSSSAGAVWTGGLVDTYVDLKDDSNVMSVIATALTGANITAEGIESNYITSVNSLSAGSAGGYDGWMILLNDWFINEGASAFSVAGGKLSAGDEIKLVYSMDGGADLGGSWANNDKTLSGVSFSAGALDKTFVSSEHTYTLTLPAGTSALTVTPTAANKNFIVKTYLGTKESGTEYKRTQSIPVTDNSVITVVCGDIGWPSMNGGEYGTADSIPGETYTFNVNIENAPPLLKDNTPASVNKSVIAGYALKLDLTAVFKDNDSESLTYKVKVNGGAYTAALADYTYTPDSAGTTNLTFIANDGISDSTDTYTVNLTAYASVNSSVTLSLQDKNEFLLVPQTVAVSSDLAESYGYVDNVYNSVSALDVLVKAQELKYKTAFTKETAADYLVVNNGTISKVNGVNTYSFSFAVNGAFPYDENSEYGAYGYTGYTIDQTKVENGGKVDFFFYQDSMYMDQYAWFEQNSSRVDEVTVKTNEDFHLSLNGFIYMFGSYTKEDLVKMSCWGTVSDAVICFVDETSGKLTAISGKTTDESGNVSLKFTESGTCYVSAYTVYDDAYTYITSPYLKVNVIDDHSGAEALTIRTGTSTANLSNAILTGANEENVAVFDRKTLTYDLGDILLDNNTQLRFWYTLAEANTKVELKWGESGSKVLTANTSTSTNISNVWANCLSAGKNVITMTVTPPAGSFNEEVTYTFTVNCKPTLSGLSATSNDTALYLDKTFAAATNEYTLTVPENAESVSFTATPKNEAYTVFYNGEASSAVNINGKDKVEITVAVGSGDDAVTNKYTVNLNKVASLSFKPVVTPSDAIVAVYDQNGAAVAKNADGSYDGLFGAAEYIYTVTKYGYVAAAGNVPSGGGSLEITLVKAADNNINNVSAEWNNFRNSDVNMGITNAKTPTVKDDTALLWNVKLGSGWSAAPSVQIIVDNALVVMSNKTIYKLDLETGEILVQGEMSAAPNFGYTPPIYAEGMIFAPLANGTVQAFNAETLESVWIYKDALKGQSLSPITYSNGYIYTGFWNGETKNANFVALSVTDEDPTATDEAKTATWKYASAGGFYWAGSVVIGDYVIVGTDDGTSGSAGTSNIMSFNKTTGERISALSLDNAGDQRSSIAYDSVSGKIYFTTKGGYLFSASFDKESGAISELKSVNYGAQSTSTPVVYDGCVYFGTGSGISSTGSSGNFVCADAETLEMRYAIGLKGYPQCSMLLSTAYEDNGYLYFYSTYNATPGGISMIKIKTDATSAADCELIELYDAEGFSQYCITSIICGNDGTLYYKNDSTNIFAVGVPKATTVVNLINAIGTVSENSFAAIDTARKAYDALSEADKAKVTNYPTLTAAENAFNNLMANKVNDLINKIGEVTLSSQNAIEAARNAYDALTKTQKALVGSYSVLTAAESEFSLLRAAEAVRLISLIPKEIKLSDESAITNARSYYSGLTADEAAKVTNLSKLTAAEEALAKLKAAKPEGATKSVTVTINGVTYEVSENTKKAVEAIEALLNPADPAKKLPENFEDLTEEAEKAILSAYKLYAALTKDEKLFVKNYPDLDKILVKLSEKYHSDKQSGFTAKGDIPWNAKLNVETKALTNAELQKIRSVLGEDAQVIFVGEIAFTDVLTGKSWQPTSPITLSAAAKTENNKNYAFVHMVGEDYEYIKALNVNGSLEAQVEELSPYAAVSFNSSWEELLSSTETKQTADFPWLWTSLAVIAIAGVAALVIYRKRQRLN